MRILVLDASYRRRVDQRDVLDQRLCACQSSRFCEEYVAGIHQQGHLAGEGDRLDDIRTTVLFIDMYLLPVVPSAYADYSVPS